MVVLQTSITSIINSSLGKIGTANVDQEYITFGSSNEVNTHINNTERLGGNFTIRWNQSSDTVTFHQM